MEKKSLSLVKIAFYCAVLLVLCPEIYSLKVMELMAPYKIQSVGNGKYLTAAEQGILGLTTGRVVTTNYANRPEQQWSMIWDPTMDQSFHGYRLESRKEYLNRVTSFYPDESTTAVPNIWEVVEISNTEKQLKNKRTRKCLQILRAKGEVVERTCSLKNRFQHWRLHQINFDKRM